MPDLKVNDAGVWKSATPWVKDGATWKKPTKVWVNDAGTWKLSWGEQVFTPPPDFYSTSTQFNTASLGVNATQPVVWTYTLTGSVTASQANGLSSTSIGFTCPKLATGTATLNASSGETWTFDFGSGGAV